MKIDENLIIGSKSELEKSKANKVGANDKGNKSLQRSGNRDDEVAISEDYHGVESLVALVKASPEIRVGKVTQLKESVKTQTYYVPSEQIAEKLIRGE